MKKNIQRQLLSGKMKYRLRYFWARRNYKDRLFVKLFHDRRALLQLYNGLNGTDYKDPNDLIITTIDDVVYMGMKNDCSFIIGSYLNLYEQQSTFCPNLPIRGLMYLVAIYQAYIAEHQYNLYGRKRIMLPTPKYIVFYNGTEERPDREECRLSESFEEKDGCLEFVAVIYNINKGHNQELMEQCSTLAGYATLIDLVRSYQNQGMELAEAVDAACVYCIDHDILREFLLKNRNEVTKVLLTEYDAKKQRKLDIRDAREEGREEAERDYALLTERLLSDHRSAELLEAARDSEVRRKLYQEYGIREK
ncbi:MAG: hypothetical protein Q4F28_09445 [Eubacteriales bacterium]|nr:hypothetical protein [Eubacteriales bacterium]